MKDMAVMVTRVTVTTTTSSPAGSGTITPASGGYYNAGSGVTLGATPAAGFTFVNFTNSGGSLAGSTITMSGPATATANFVGPADPPA